MYIIVSKMLKHSFVIIFALAICDASAQHTAAESKFKNSLPEIPVNKCCESNEVLVGSRCAHVNETGSSEWQPVFTDPKTWNDNIQVNHKLVIGLPDCGTTQQWSVYHYDTSFDKLILLPTGVLRHYIHHNTPEDVEAEPVEGQEQRHYDYKSGQYCIDKRLDENGTRISRYAIICTPEIETDWTDTDFLIRKIIDPICHAVAMMCYLTIAIIYFVIPTLRDLVGNIVTTISLCLITSSAADMVKIFTEFSSHVSFLVADVFMYVSLLGAFFWLNSMGYYIWRQFKSRHVCLRVTDGRKYCYYSFYAWGSTLTLGSVALFAHFMLDMPNKSPSSFLYDQETIGWLGIVVFFTPVAVTILVNILFYTTTLQIINRMHTYGRIHDKLKNSFRMFLMLFVIMSVAWLFLLLSWLQFDELFYIYVFVNSLQAPLILYVCVFDQKHVLTLVRKSCCYNNCLCPCCRPEPECDWGDEMQAMNTGIY